MHFTVSGWSCNINFNYIFNLYPRFKEAKYQTSSFNCWLLTLMVIRSKINIQKNKRPSLVSNGTCRRFRGAVLSSVETWSSVTYRALVANAVITKQSCSRIKKEKNIKTKGGDERWSQELLFSFLISVKRLGNFLMLGYIFVFQSHILSRNSPVWCHGCVSHAKALKPQ